MDKQDTQEIKFKKICFSPENQSSLVVVPQNAADTLSWEEPLNALSSEYNIYFLDMDLPKASELEVFGSRVVAGLREIGVLRATLMGIGEGGSLAQAMALANKKLVRRLVLINATCRVNPSMGSKIIDYLETLLPFGLPLRSLGKDYDSRPFAHRIDCPVLVLTTSSASTYEVHQSEFLSARLPNAWVASTNGAGEVLSPEVIKTIGDFAAVPARVPQK